MVSEKVGGITPLHFYGYFSIEKRKTWENDHQPGVGRGYPVVGSPLVQLSHGFQVGVTLLDLCCVSTAATA